MIVLLIGAILSFAVHISAGPGGSVFLINLSGSDWNLIHQKTRKMNAWKFPNALKDGDTSQVYVEFRFISLSKDYGRADYELEGTGGKSFQIWAYRKPRRIEVVYNNLEIDGQPIGLRRNLGWRQNGETNIIIIKANGTYTGTSLDGSNWMRNNIGWLGRRTLKQLSIPGSHDAGMSKINGGTAFGKKCNSLTQSKTIKGQLELGMRYFDIRPVIGNGGKYLTGHYSHIKSSYQGANGQSIDSIIDDLNSFTKDHNELVIVSLSHTFNTDVGSNSYRPFKQPEWDELFKKLDTTNNLYFNSKGSVSLKDLTLSDFTKHGTKSAVLFIVEESGIQLGNRTGKGYFSPKNLKKYDNYANTNNWSKMVDDQIKKMEKYSKNQYFLLSWTTTQSGTQAAFCVAKRQSISLKSLVEEANKHLGHLLYNAVSKTSFPNIILVDEVKDTDVTALALAITRKVYS